MKRNHFRLASVHRVRQIQEEIELGRLGALRLAAEQAHAHVERCVTKLRALGVTPDAATPLQEFLADRATIERLGDELTASRSAVSAAEHAVREQLVVWSHAAQRVSGLDRLHERHIEDIAVELLAEEVKEADERTMQLRVRQLHDASIRHNHHSRHSAAIEEIA